VDFDVVEYEITEVDIEKFLNNFNSCNPHSVLTHLDFETVIDVFEKLTYLDPSIEGISHKLIQQFQEMKRSELHVSSLQQIYEVIAVYRCITHYSIGLMKGN
jgi:EAL domain-containing protein (putative c-di-GMP-specific phosphodiesterase class I)